MLWRRCVVVFEERRTFRGGNDWIARRRLTRCTGNGCVGTPGTYCRKLPTTPRAGSPPPATSINRYSKRRNLKSELLNRLSSRIIRGFDPQDPWPIIPSPLFNNAQKRSAIDL